MVNLDLVCDLVHRLTQKVRQHVRANLSGLFPCLRIARCCHPNRQHLGHRAWLCDHSKGRAIFGRKFNCIAPPQRAQLFNRGIHRRLVFRRRVFGAQHKIVRLPTAGNCQTDAAIGQVVDDRPFLSNTGGMVQGGHARPRPHIQILRHRRHRSPGHRRVRVRTTKGMEMSFWCPDGVKAVGIRKFRTLQQQFIFLRANPIIIAPIEQVKVNLAVRCANGAV